jgi:hypothetical protein
MKDFTPYGLNISLRYQKMKDSLKDSILLNLTHKQFYIVWESLSQYVENEECNMLYEDPYKESKNLLAARDLLDKCDAFYAEMDELV